VKIGEHRVDEFELFARENKNVGLAAFRTETTARVGATFKHPATRRPDRDDPPPRFFRGIESSGNFFGQNEKLGVHFVFGNFGNFDRRESPEPDMQNNFFNLNPALF